MRNDGDIGDPRALQARPLMSGVRGTLYLNTSAGRSLRREPMAVRAADVLYSSAAMRANDVVYLAFRSKDGAQYVVATGVLARDVAVFSYAERRTQQPGAITGTEVLVQAQTVQLLWPPS